MNQLNFLMQIQTMWSCASWQVTMRTTWRCRSTLPCYSRSVATLASPSCESQGFRDSSSCWEQRMPTKIRKSMGTSTACWLRTLRLIIAGYRRWAHTARRADAFTSGCLNWSCRNADWSGAPSSTTTRASDTDELKDLMWLKQGWPSVDSDRLTRLTTSRNQGLPVSH